MSTRACIKIKNGVKLNYDDKKLTECVITLYHHCDGYPDGVGKDLKKYLAEVVSKWAWWNPETIATQLVRGVIKDNEGLPDRGYEVAICEHGDCEYGYLIDCDNQTLTCYDLDSGIKPWKRKVAIPGEEPKRQILVKHDKALSHSRCRDYYLDPKTGRYYVQVDGKWTTTTNNYELEPDCSVANNIEIVVVEEKSEYHGGEEVFSKKHGKNIHIMFAHHSQVIGENPKLDYYMMVDGTKVMPEEVEDKH